MRFREVRLPKDPDCPVCGRNPTIRTLRAYDQFCAPAPSGNDDMTVTELKSRIDRRTAPTVIDVREPSENQICRIPGTILIPLGDLPAKAHELDPSTEIVLHCKSGARSARATQLLRERGFANARNLRGGILAWI